MARLPDHGKQLVQRKGNPMGLKNLLQYGICDMPECLIENYVTLALITIAFLSMPSQ